jgi:small subunit ribosomal protein S20
MPQHKSAEKRVRQTVTRRARNRTYVSSMRTMIKKLETTTDRSEAITLLNETKSYLDKLTSKGVIKANKAANTKGRLERKVATL